MDAGDAEKLVKSLTDQEVLKLQGAITAELGERGLAIAETVGPIATAKAVEKTAEITGVKEQILDQLPVSYHAYVAVAQELNAVAKRKDEIEVTDQETLQAELAAWLTDEKLGWVRSSMEANPNLLFTLVATPNVAADAKQIAHVAKVFGKDQPYSTYVYGELYAKYTPQELSGTDPETGKAVQFSLIPSSRITPEIRGTVKQQQAKLAELQAFMPDLKVPSVLEAVTYWQTLRHQGDPLADDSALHKTYIRHFDLEPKLIEHNWQVVPGSSVYPGGEPHLDHSMARYGANGRVAVG